MGCPRCMVARRSTSNRWRDRLRTKDPQQGLRSGVLSRVRNSPQCGSPSGQSGTGEPAQAFPRPDCPSVAIFDENIGDLEALARRLKITLNHLLVSIIGHALVSTAFTNMVMPNLTTMKVAYFGVQVVVECKRATSRISATVDINSVSELLSTHSSVSLAQYPSLVSYSERHVLFLPRGTE